MPDMPWREAIEEVLREAGEAMHYTAIADAIASSGRRTSVGATPASTVAAVISTSRKDEGSGSPFIRVAPGEYALASLLREEPASSSTTTEDEGNEGDRIGGAIRAFGMYWERSLVAWKSRPVILGRQGQKADPVDIHDQVGVYLLHDVRGVVYAGQSALRPLGSRLYEHTTDRLKTRWDRFSWFGLSAISESGVIQSPSLSFNAHELIDALEAVLIEAVEPPQNRRQGQGFAGIEFIQAQDPAIEQANVLAVIDDLRRRIEERPNR